MSSHFFHIRLVVATDVLGSSSLHTGDCTRHTYFIFAAHIYKTQKQVGAATRKITSFDATGWTVVSKGVLGKGETNVLRKGPLSMKDGLNQPGDYLCGLSRNQCRFEIF